MPLAFGYLMEEKMDCKKVDFCLGNIAGLAEGAHKALHHGDSYTVEMKLREIEKRIRQIRKEQQSIRGSRPVLFGPFDNA